jgi:alpha-glucosidase
VLSNHDAARHATRYDHPTLGDARTRLAALMLLTLRGTPFLYQGEEIGMRCVTVPPDRLQDPLAFRLHPNLSRDPSRTPLPWEPGPGAGFTTGEPWLPLGEDAAVRNVATQRNDPDSLLHLYRALLELRRRTPALVRGAFRALRAPRDVFAYERREGRQRAVVALNFGDADAAVSLGRGRLAEGIHTRAGADVPERLGRLVLGPCEGVVAVVA